MSVEIINSICYRATHKKVGITIKPIKAKLYFRVHKLYEAYQRMRPMGASCVRTTSYIGRIYG
jgi:hypothetical protein